MVSLLGLQVKAEALFQTGRRTDHVIEPKVSQVLGIQEKVERHLPSGRRHAALEPFTHFIFRAVSQESCRRQWRSQGHLHGIQKSGPCGQWGLWVMSPQPDSLTEAPTPSVESKAILPPYMASKRPALGLRAREQILLWAKLSLTHNLMVFKFSS